MGAEIRQKVRFAHLNTHLKRKIGEHLGNGSQGRADQRKIFSIISKKEGVIGNLLEKVIET